VGVHDEHDRRVLVFFCSCLCWLDCRYLHSRPGWKSPAYVELQSCESSCVQCDILLRILQPQYAFLLHLYSSPLGSIFNRIADPFSGQKPASRPNRHVLMTMFLPLLQITLLHTQGIWKDYSRDVLIPTSICGIIGMASHDLCFLIRRLPVN
jgi:hypothetical protein